MDSSKKNKLFTSLRRKMKIAGAAHTSDETDSDEAEEMPVTMEKSEKHTKSKSRNKQVGNRNASKVYRTIQLGWIHEGKVTRLKTGGGTRKLYVKKHDTKSQLIEEGKKVFFRDGVSKRGRVSDFTFDIVDFEENTFASDITVGQLYSMSKLPLLRFYLLTKRIKKNLKLDASVDLACDSHDDTLPLYSDEDGVTEKDSPIASNTSKCGLPDRSPTKRDTENMGNFQLPNLKSKEVVIIHGSVSDSDSELPDLVKNDTVTSHNSVSASDLKLPDLKNEEIVTTNNSVADHELSGGFLQEELAAHEMGSICLGNAEQYVAELDPLSVGEQIEIIEADPARTLTVLQNITVNRVNILHDLICVFKTPDLIHWDVKFEFKNEKGADERGVSREVFSCFWNEFFMNATEGEVYHVPAVNTKWLREEWKAVARILVKGFTELGYFPLKLAPAFVTAIIFGEDHITPEILLESFFHFLSTEDGNIVKSAMNDTLSSEEEDTFIDILSSLGSHTIPKDNEIKPAILHIAHIKLVQEPRYMADCFFDVGSTPLRKIIQSTKALQELYDNVKPSVSKVVQLMKVVPNTLTRPQEKSYQFLLQYIRAQSDLSLPKLLRFLTGADMMCIREIAVEFTDLTGLARRPIAHCCGPTLELPSTYCHYRELRKEFDAVLSHDLNLRMDIA